ncbi:MAG: copper amine oxidase [Paenibacillus sp.]|nr:copper amine oxidase [Paenibacillus sp.]
MINERRSAPTLMTRKLIVIFVTLVLAVVVSLPEPRASAADNSWPLHLQAEQYRNSGQTSLALPIWDELIRISVGNSDWNSAAIYAGNMNEYFDAVHDYENAVKYYEMENQFWLNDGKDWGANSLERAHQLRTTIELFASVSANPELEKKYLPASGTLAIHEPAYGMYIGLYSERDPAMGNFFNRSQSIYGRDHSMYLAYATYGEEFPARYASNAKAAGSALQVAWQPLQGLDPVKDDAYLREWAKQASQSGIPIFLRFAGEMNGDWTPWAGDPQVFINKFRIIAKVMHELAPNVAMVWSPGDVPRYNMATYYPGDDYVDWVGVSMYTEPYSFGNVQTSMLGSTPIEKLDEIYKLYADRKPVMLSETAVSHHTNTDGVEHTQYALMNMERLYRIMPLKYPRLKAITYFNVNLDLNESKNNYSLYKNEQIFKQYKNMIEDPYYIQGVKTGAKPSNAILYQDETKPIRKQTTWIPFVRIPQVFISKLEFVLNGQVIGTRTEYPFELDVMAGDIPEGSVLEIRVYDYTGARSASRSIPVSSQVSVSINQVDQQFEQPPVIVNGNTLAPLRAIFEAMGAEVSWDENSKTATGRKNGKVVSVTIGSKVAKIDGKSHNLEESAQLVNGYTMGPARFIGEAFGGEVLWEGRTREVIIKK